MPLYEYECQQCHRRLEKIQKFSDAELTVCPHCSGKLERTITAPAFQFAGGGWYKDGYGNAKPAAAGGESTGGNTGAATSGGQAASNSSDSPSTSSEAKPAAPSAPAAAPAAATPSTTKS